MLPPFLGVALSYTQPRETTSGCPRRVALHFHCSLERNVEFRQIFTDARALPKDPQPSWYLSQHLLLDSDLLEYACLENEKNVPRLVGK